MGKVIKPLVLFFAAIGLLITLYFVFRAVSSIRQGYSWQEMDWSQHRSTSISDFFAASDIGKRDVVKDEKKCTEYYAYKDGLPVKTVCPK
jgi:hypothetical protein